jgi:hypothetical protein
LFTGDESPYVTRRKAVKIRRVENATLEMEDEEKAFTVPGGAFLQFRLSRARMAGLRLQAE